MKFTCGVCSGTGFIQRKAKWEKMSEKVKDFKKAGYSFREIARKFGFKSVNTVYYYFKKEAKP